MKQVISGLLAEAFVTLVLLAPAGATEVTSVLNICNVGNAPLFAVVIGSTRHDMSIDGWRQIDIGDCYSTTVSFHGILGFAIADANGRKGMQVYDGSIAPDPAFTPTEGEWCVDPDRNFHVEHTRKISTVCGPDQVLARFAFHVKPTTSETLTLRIPADKDGDAFPLTRPAASLPFDPITFTPLPATSFQIAMQGLAEQQQRLGFRGERSDPAPIPTGYTYCFVRELGIVARPETHVVMVATDSPAEKAGILRGDEIVRIDNIGLRSAWHARSLLTRTRPGETHIIALLRAGQLREARIRLESMPASLAATDLHPKQGWLGIEVESGARILAVTYREGTDHLEPGDDVQKIGRMDFDGMDGLAQWFARNTDARTVELQVRLRSTGRIRVITLDKLP
jgi:hypothetical protein